MIKTTQHLFLRFSNYSYARIVKYLFMSFYLIFYVSPALATSNTDVSSISSSIPDKKIKKSSVSLSQLWVVDTHLVKPEAVIFDPKSQHLLVSNINKGGNKLRDGFISKIDLTGNIVQLKWIDKLISPTGSTIHGTNFWVVDRGELNQFDLSTGELIQRFSANNSGFLNDVAAFGENGDIYVSDSANSQIYKLVDGQLNVWLKENIYSPNGMNTQDDILLVNASSTPDTPEKTAKQSRTIQVINTETKQVKLYTTHKIIGALDGIERMSDGSFLLSNVGDGIIYHLSKEDQLTELIHLGSGTADITYIKDKNILVVPHLRDNKLFAFKVNISL